MMSSRVCTNCPNAHLAPSGPTRRSFTPSEAAARRWAAMSLYISLRICSGRDVTLNRAIRRTEVNVGQPPDLLLRGCGGTACSAGGEHPLMVSGSPNLTRSCRSLGSGGSRPRDSAGSQPPVGRLRQEIGTNPRRMPDRARNDSRQRVQRLTGVPRNRTSSTWPRSHLRGRLHDSSL
jgi:hypothetical protein